MARAPISSGSIAASNPLTLDIKQPDDATLLGEW